MASNSLSWLFVARGVCGRRLKKNPTIDEGNDIMITMTATNRYKNITYRIITHTAKAGTEGGREGDADAAVSR